MLPTRIRVRAATRRIAKGRRSVLDRLVLHGVIKAEDRDRVKEMAAANGHQDLPGLLESLGILERRKWISFMADDLGIPHLPKIHNTMVDAEILRHLPKRLARLHNVLPLFKIYRDLTLLVADPLDVNKIQDIEAATGFNVLPVIGDGAEIAEAIERFYPSDEALDDVLIEMVDEYEDHIEVVESVDIAETEMTGKEAPIIKLVNLIITEALNARASDIHIEPGETNLRIRYRVDGFLRETIEPAKRFQASIVSRIKIMAAMDIAEKRKPQDGRIKIRALNRDIDLRVSSLPGIHGEKIVMRILDPSILNLNLEDLGFSANVYTRYQATTERPHGIILVTGPTGSGKSTTLYATLNRLNTKDRNIVAIEDPVEYQLAGINQVQVNPRVGITFAGALRSVLRQDPDIIMVGEMRDAETAETAIRAALTGHLVFSTLHTNDAPGAMTRLLDMGVAPFLVASSVIGVLAQRLVRVICQNCKGAYEATKGEKERLGLDPAGPLTLYKGDGCSQCEHSGFMGRIACHEFLAVDDAMRNLVMQRASTDEVREAARRGGMRTLWQDTIEKVLSGTTTLYEVGRTVTMEGYRPAAEAAAPGTKEEGGPPGL